MPITYAYDSDANIVYTNAAGVVDEVELKQYFEKILSDERISSGFWEVVNIESATNVTLNYKDCVALTPLVKRFIIEKNYQGALLYSPRKLPYLAAKLFFTVLNTTLPVTLYVSNNKNEFQELVYKNLQIKYDFGDTE